MPMRSEDLSEENIISISIDQSARPLEPKMPKAASSASARGGPSKTKPARHDPLHVALNEDEELYKFGRITKPGKRRQKEMSGDEDEAAPTVEGARMSRKILDLAREQRDEMEGDGDEDDEDA